MARRYRVDRTSGRVIDRKTGKQATAEQAAGYRARLAREAEARKLREGTRIARGQPRRPSRSTRKPTQAQRVRAARQVAEIKSRRRARKAPLRKIESRQDAARGVDLVGAGPLTGHFIAAGSGGAVSLSARQELADKLAAEFKRRGIKGSGTVRIRGSLVVVDTVKKKDGKPQLVQVPKDLTISGSPSGIAEQLTMGMAPGGQAGKGKYAAGYHVQGVSISGSDQGYTMEEGEIAGAMADAEAEGLL